MIVIRQQSEDMVSIHTNDDETIKCLYDKFTGDWCVVSPGMDPPLETWVLSRDGAIQYALGQAGVLDDPSYERAPERCV